MKTLKPMRRRLWVSAWLLAAGLVACRAAEAQPGSGFHQRALAVPVEGHTGFALLAPEQTGIAFSNHLADATAAENQIRLIGSGVALGDVDGDGRCDIYLCQLEGGNALYRNLGGWKFTNVTAAAGVECAGQFSTGSFASCPAALTMISAVPFAFGRR